MNGAVSRKVLMLSVHIGYVMADANVCYEKSRVLCYFVYYKRFKTRLLFWPPWLANITDVVYVGTHQIISSPYWLDCEHKAEHKPNSEYPLATWYVQPSY